MLRISPLSGNVGEHLFRVFHDQRKLKRIPYPENKPDKSAPQKEGKKLKNREYYSLFRTYTVKTKQVYEAHFTGSKTCQRNRYQGYQTHQTQYKRYIDN